MQLNDSNNASEKMHSCISHLKTKRHELMHRPTNLCNRLKYVSLYSHDYSLQMTLFFVVKLASLEFIC